MLSLIKYKESISFTVFDYLDSRVKMGLILIKRGPLYKKQEVTIISKASENERHQVIMHEAPGMTIAYFGYGNPTPDSTDLTVQRPDFGTVVTYLIGTNFI